jgi:hypothetical protein
LSRRDHDEKILQALRDKINIASKVLGEEIRKAVKGLLGHGVFADMVACFCATLRHMLATLHACPL